MLQERLLAPVGGNVQKSPPSKAAALLRRGAYTQYVNTTKGQERRWRLFSTFHDIFWKGKAAGRFRARSSTAARQRPEERRWRTLRKNSGHACSTASSVRDIVDYIDQCFAFVNGPDITGRISINVPNGDSRKSGRRNRIKRRGRAARREGT